MESAELYTTVSLELPFPLAEKLLGFLLARKTRIPLLLGILTESPAVIWSIVVQLTYKDWL